MPALPVSTAIITNIQSEVETAESGPGVSLVIIQSTRALAYCFRLGDPWRPSLILDGTTRIPDSYLPVHDGLIQGISLVHSLNLVCLALDLAQPSGFAIRRSAGPPHLLCLAVDRQPLHRIMNARHIYVDPGYNDADRGGYDSASTREKDKSLATALYLAEHLSGLGCRVTLSRRGDRAVSLDSRLAGAVERQADIIVALHTSWHPDSSLRGIRVLWHTKSGLPLARRVYRALGGKLSMPDRGIEPGRSWEFWTEKPAVTVEFAAVGNPVERTWLRDSSFLGRVAGGIANGLSLYFYAAGHSPSRKGIGDRAANDADEKSGGEFD